MEKEEKDDYIDWLEDLCLVLLSNSKRISKERIIKKIKEKGITIENDFIECLYEKNSKKQKEIIRKLPLLKTYPIGVFDDIYDDDIEKIYKWEMDIIKKLLLKLQDQYEDKHITLEVYSDFFDREIKPYKEYLNILYEEMYEKILPENMSLYWSYRIDKNISWDKSWDLNNVGISIISVVENDYLNKDKHMGDYRHLIGGE